MKILKNGTKKFGRLYHVFWNKYECPSCGAVFEAQTGEVEFGNLECPFCEKNHMEGEYKTWLNYRDEWVNFKFVKGYDCLVNESKIIEIPTHNNRN